MTKLYEKLEQLQGKYLEALRTAVSSLVTVELETQALLRDPSNAEELKQVGIISNQASIKGAKISATASMRIEKEV
jgi:hypothetical protein